MRMTLSQACEHAGTAVHMDRQKADEQFGAGLFDKAIEHHTKRGLSVDLTKGTTRDRAGLQSRFINYIGEQTYTDAPHFVWFDFFRGAVLNSCSRMARGLEP